MERAELNVIVRSTAAKPRWPCPCEGSFAPDACTGTGGPGKDLLYYRRPKHGDLRRGRAKVTMKVAHDGSLSHHFYFQGEQFSRVCLFVACGIAKIAVIEITKAIWPFLIVLIMVLFLATYVTLTTLWLPKLFLS